MISQNKKALLICIIGLALLIIHSLYYMPFLSDDSLISLRYVQRFLQGSGLTWNDGIKVEGYSNLLWVLLSGLLGSIGIDLIDSVRILGYICGFIIITTPYLLYIKGIIRSLLSLAISTFFLAFCAPLAIWTIGGLEQPLVAALLCLFLIYFVPLEKNTWAIPGIFLALIAITRPDGILFAGCACLSILILKGISKQSIVAFIKVMILPMLFFTAHLLFRYAYYGMLVPNTALVKISFSMHRLLSGSKYIGIGVASLFPFSILVPFILCKLFKSDFYKLLTYIIGTTITVWLCYLIFIGGDIFPGSRHFLPIIPLFAVVLGVGAEVLLQQVSEKNRSLKTISLISFAFLIYVPLQFLFPNNARAKEERWEWDGKAIATMLKEEWHTEKPLFAITAAGCLPYWTEFPCIDMLGLNDFYIPRHPPTEFGKGYLGHDLGDANYVLSKSPDLISFCGPNGSLEPCFIADRQLTEKTEFQKKYIPAYFQTPPPLITRAIVWVNSNSASLGYKIAKDTIVIPCWLLSSAKIPVTQSASRKFKITVGAKDTIFVRGIYLPKGTWQIKTQSDDYLHAYTLASNGYSSTINNQITALVSSGAELNTTIALHAFAGLEIEKIVFVRAVEKQ